MTLAAPQVYDSSTLSTPLENSDLPPPYEMTDSEAQQLCNRIQDTVVAEKGGAHKDSLEAESLRNFLLYCLAVDYHVSAPRTFILSASEREHYAEMSGVFLDIRDS